MRAIWAFVTARDKTAPAGSLRRVTTRFRNFGTPIPKCLPVFRGVRRGRRLRPYVVLALRHGIELAVTFVARCYFHSRAFLGLARHPGHPLALDSATLRAKIADRFLARIPRCGAGEKTGHREIFWETD
jgi:hypothetical protein